MRNILYIMSLLILGLAFYFIVANPSSTRGYAISGMLLPLGVFLNIGAFLIPPNRKAVQNN